MRSMATPASSPTPTPAARVERSFAAPADRVYRAWLDPELRRRWLAPGDAEVTRVEVEERVGGRYARFQKSFPTRQQVRF